MKYFIENSRVVIRGKDASGKPYRFVVKMDDSSITVDKKNWNQTKQTVKGAPVLNTFLKDLKTRIQGMVLSNKASNPSYSVPNAWAELFPTATQRQERLSNKVVECIDPYLRDNSGSKSAGYLRHYTQLKSEIAIWNKDVQFEHLNEITLNSYLTYLQGKGTPARSPLKSSTIGHHFKHLRQVSKYVAQRGVKVDPSVYSFSAGPVVYVEGCFDLEYSELMVLWHYTPKNQTEEVTLDYCLFEAFTGIRNGDLYSLKPDGSEHGLKCGDISRESIGYRDRKNHDMIKTVTRHKFNDRIIQKYWSDEANRFLLPPMAQQTINRTIKDIAKACDLNRPIRRGAEMKPLHEVVASHCFRASYGNLLYRQGVTSEIVGEELGHAAANVTIRHYLKFSNRHEIIREKMNALEIKAPEEKISSLRKVV